MGKGHFDFREERKCLVAFNYTKTLFKQANKAKCQSLSEFKIALAYYKIWQKLKEHYFVLNLTFVLHLV